MEYQALYRKHRPQTFGEVVGQDHVTTALRREIIDGKIAHAYLFAGPRGTGKTTTARLLAKSLNCENPGDDGEPDNICTSCLAITGGTSLDVIELDAASHNKVEDIREIRINVGTVAVGGGSRRIYILDEAHMLSRAAGNALLKTLEEPPEHVVFVLATTEPYKLLDTIRSRAQRFDFHPVAAETLSAYVKTIADRESFSIDRAALGLVTSHADGSVRDALSLLEQVAALGGGTVEAEAVTRALGLADKEAFATLAEAVEAQDAPAALSLVAALASQGADLRRFVAEAVGFFRGVFLAQYAPNLEEVADEPLEVLDEWRRHASRIAASDVLRAIDQLSEALFQLRQGREERLVVELALLRLTRPDTASDVDAVAARLSRLEARVREMGNQLALGESPSPATTSATVSEVEEPEAPPDVTPKLESEEATPPEAAPSAEPLVTDDTPPVALDLPTFESAWPAIVARVREEAGPRRHAFVKVARPVDLRDGAAILAIPSDRPFHLEQLLADHELQKVLSAIASDILGGRIALEFEQADDEADGDGVATTEPERSPAPEELLEEGADGTDPTALVVDILGGEVVSD